MGFEPQTNPEQFRVLYKDLGGGRNTRQDSHAIKRNQLAISINGWIPAANSFGKRPGNQACVTPTGATGSNLAGTGMAVARFGSVSSVIVQSGTGLYTARPGIDTSYVNIGSISSNAGPITLAQIYDSITAADAAFICDGVDKPQIWNGSGHSLVPITLTNFPLNHSGSAPITPAYCSTLLSSLWYAGEPTEPTGVYISDPTAPQSFTYGGNLPGAAYIPYLIGFNDGINGGKITGIAPLGSSMMVYKESAIYRFDHIGYYGDVGPWFVTLVSASVGMVAPRSLAVFDSFHCFLGIDGVYTCDGQATSKRPISDNNPDLFDGPGSAIASRTSAIGVRVGSRYLLFYDNGGL